jgi:toxin HigB-1
LLFTASRAIEMDNGQWAMTVNDRWRICLEFRKGDAYDVEIVDYHKG